VLSRGTTFDLMVTDVYATWERHQQNPTDMTNFSTDELQKVLERAKNGG
jgi:hypothetical protein